MISKVVHTYLLYASLSIKMWFYHSYIDRIFFSKKKKTVTCGGIYLLN